MFLEASNASSLRYDPPGSVPSVADLVESLRFVSQVYAGCKPADLEDYLAIRASVRNLNLLIPARGAKYGPARKLLLEAAARDPAGRARSCNGAKLCKILKDYAANLPKARRHPDMALWVFHYSRGVARSSGPVVHLRSLRVISNVGEGSASDSMEMGNLGSQYAFRSAGDAQSHMEVLELVLVGLWLCICFFVSL